MKRSGHFYFQLISQIILLLLIAVFGNAAESGIKSGGADPTTIAPIQTAPSFTTGSSQLPALQIPTTQTIQTLSAPAAANLLAPGSKSADLPTARAATPATSAPLASKTLIAAPDAAPELSFTERSMQDAAKPTGTSMVSVATSVAPSV